MPSIIPKSDRLICEAKKLFDAGLWVVPVVDKCTTVKDWPNTRIEWDDLEQRLKVNPTDIAIVLNQSDYIDVEYDTPGGETALLELFGGEIPPTPTWQSKRGKHRLFQRPEGLPQTSVIDYEGVEFRVANGKGALSTVPPSGGRKWLPKLSIHDLPPAPLPDHIADALRASKPEPVSTATAAELIPEGKRNDVLFQKGCALKGVVPDELILPTLQEINLKACETPLTEAEVAAIAKSVAKASPSTAKDTFLDRMVNEIELWRDQGGQPYATVPNDGHLENWMLNDSDQFRPYLSKRYYESTKKSIGSGTLSDICSTLEGIARFDGPQYQATPRVSGHDGKIYIDLCNDSWQAIQIDKDGWRVVDIVPIKFTRADGMHALPLPKQSGDSLKSLLKPFINITEEGWPVYLGFMVSCVRPHGPYPILKIQGRSGTAKTSTTKYTRRIIDPNLCEVSDLPPSQRDLMLQATNSWMPCFDNISHLNQDWSDALCRLSTGGGYRVRANFRDGKEKIFNVCRPCVLTSIEEVGVRPDLLQRSVIVEQPTITEEQFIEEDLLGPQFAEAHPYILGALLDAVVVALNRLPEIQARPNKRLSRMADFQRWAEAAEPGLGLKEGEFIESYRANQREGDRIVLESSSLYNVLSKYLVEKNGLIEQTASELLDNLNARKPSSNKETPGWPKAPDKLSAQLNQIAPNLEKVGIFAVKVDIGGGNDHRKAWKITRPDLLQAPKVPTKPKPQTPPKTPLGKKLAAQAKKEKR